MRTSRHATVISVALLPLVTSLTGWVSRQKSRAARGWMSIARTRGAGKGTSEHRSTRAFLDF
ncbi:hypothetical protein HSB1_06660 [Halogranum salarium B-1]|uniref:Uncharacterized protein n=1 Tax=Halogranum salarium B-1 TaxID=1210908 RepID=J2ZLJ1_9EURY|nr:hypothetical protein HSB1_06660 [Halogranum salarium B-1]